MDYEHKAKAVAERLQSYKRDESGWKVCKKSVNVLFGMKLLDIPDIFCYR